MKKMSREDRVIIAESDFILFFAHYLPHYVEYKFAPFHFDMAVDIHDLIDGTIKELSWIAYRESGKTSFAKGLLLYLICFHLDEYINVDSYDKENAERILFDVVWELQTNKRILDDFGQLYNAPRSKDQISQKRVSNFVTNPPEGTTGIRVEAHSTQEPVRGRLHGSKRPGFILIDDYENKKTIKSEEYTKNIREHIQEFKGGIDSTRGRVLYLANYLSEFANVQSIIERSKVDSALRVRIVPIADDFGNPTWPEKYVLEDKDRKGDLVSIEEIRRRMWLPESGDDDFMAEMMCRPIDYSNSEFKKEWFDQNKYMEPDLKDLQLKTFICFDNAPSLQKNSDWIGCIVASVDIGDIWYLRYVKRYKLNTPDLIEEIFRLYDIYHPLTMGVEQKAYESLIQPFLEKRSKELKVYPYVVELKDGGKHKEDRIRGTLQGRFKNGMIKLLKYATDDTNDLVKELAQFPYSKFDDLSDSLAYIHQIAYQPQPVAGKQPVTMQEYKVRDVQEAFSAYEKRRDGTSQDTI